MKIIRYLLLLSLGTSALSSRAVLHEPTSSLMSSGRWVKIRVHDDAIYQFTYDELRALGFSNPAKVKVYGYNPTILLTHDDSQIPADVAPVYTYHSSEENKLVFYGKGDTDFAPELWTEITDVNKFLHRKHVHGIDATYFISDVDSEDMAISTTSAPDNVASRVVMDSHTSLVYNEDEVENLVEGGSWFAGQPLNSIRETETHQITVDRVASANARIVYQGLMSPTGVSQYNYLLAQYSEGITSEQSTGIYANIVGTHQAYRHAVRYQKLNIPVQDAEASYDITFSVHPQAANMSGNCMLDFFGFLYQRKNNLGGLNQAKMYFENYDAAKCFKLTGINSGWQVWNVNKPMAPVKIGLKSDDSGFYGSLNQSTKTVPNEVVAFDIAAKQPTPEVLGEVENQNLHLLNTPDMVIVTSRMFLESADKIADMHSRLQGLNVEVVDQQKIFNEYSSGNTSPEGVRRFLSHLSSKSEGKLKAVLLLGPGTYLNATLVNDDMPYVVTAEAEEYIFCSYVTKAYASDTFFGHFGSLITGGYWPQRGPHMQIVGNDIDIAVGRVALSSAREIEDYYAKVEEYISMQQTFPSIGDIVVVSDYSSKNEKDHHLANAEAFISSFGDKAGTTITVNRAANNLWASAQKAIPNRIVNSALERGASVFAYFGHGKASDIGGSGSYPFFYDLQSVEKINTPGKYPFMYFGSCKVGPFDRSGTNLSNEFLANRYGGAIAVVSSGREVFPTQNQELGQAVVKFLNQAADGEFMGRIWTRAQQQCIQVPNASREAIANHLSYNYFGDPAIPYRVETHSVSLSAPDNNSVFMCGRNVMSGTVNNALGEVDESFNGMVTLTFYEVPEVKKNVAGDTSNSGVFYSSVTCDQQIIGEVLGSVTNGRFEVEYTGPISLKSGTHRLRAFACSDDATKRGLGYLADLSFVGTDEEPESPVAQPTSIRSFDFVEGVSANNAIGESALLTATIHIPSGLAGSSSLSSAIKLSIDGNTSVDMQKFAKFTDVDVCEVSYAVRSMAYGRHTAKLSVLDRLGVWTDAEIEFMVDNTTTSSLSAAVDDKTVSFELMSSMAGTADKRLVVERLNGDVVISRAMSSPAETVELPAGAYRAYVQLRGANSASATPKIEVVVD